MDSLDKNKLLRAGFRIVRAEDYPCPRITEYKDYASTTGDYYTIVKFYTKAERDRALQQMLIDPKTVED